MMKSSAMTTSTPRIDLVVDTSAIVAILLGEPERARFDERIDDATHPVISAASLLECVLVVDRRKTAEGVDRLRLLLDAFSIDMRPVDAIQAEAAIDAHLRFGRGRHPARLNYGDCFAYALAKTADAPLLFKGGDFARTDVTSAL